MINLKNKIIISSIVLILMIVLVGGYFVWPELYINFSEKLGINLKKEQYANKEAVEETIVTPDGQQIKAFVSADGVSPISEDGKVIDRITGKEVDNSVPPSSPTAPKQSNPLSSSSNLPSSVIKINAQIDSGFSPKSFEVKSGEPVTISLTSMDSYTYVFAFDDPSLSAVAIGVAPQETRVISFNAPKVKGEYQFFSNVPGHRGRGLVGKMIVK